jgi:Lon protease-like protein
VIKNNTFWIALFPLQNAYTLYGVIQPYHIFEPRYRSMIADALEEGQRISVVPPQNADLQFENLCCVAGLPRVLQKYDDGRMDIILPGEERFKIRRVDRSRSYLRAEVEPLSFNLWSPLEEKEAQFELGILKNYLNQWAAVHLAEPNQRQAFTSLFNESSVLLGYSCLFLLAEPSLKTAFLKAQSQQEQLQILLENLGPKEIDLGPILGRLKF